MAVIKDYIGWPTNVNRIILDSTTITLGENATRTDELENGLKKTRLRGALCPDTYQVTMEFDWSTLGDDGYTEIQRFYEWYKFKHKYGSIPFEFPKIIYSHLTGIPSEDINANTRVEYYKITSAINGSKHGMCQKVTMTWQTVYGGVISVEDFSSELTSIVATPTYVDCHISVGSESPVSQDFSLTVGNSAITPNGFIFDGSSTVRLYYSKRAVGTDVHVSYNGITKSTTVA